MEERPSRSPRGRLADPRYRAEMLARLDSLIAVLRLAQHKASSAPAKHAEQAERLTRMHRNLSRTLDVCDYARRSLNAPQPHGQVPLGQPGSGQAPQAGCFAESSNLEEFRRLRELGPLQDEAPSAAEIEALCAQLIADQEE